MRGPGSSCPHARPTGKGGGCVCPRSLWGQRKLGRGGWGLRSAQRPEGGERERGGSVLAGFSFICAARQSTQQFAARHPWKKPFSVEVNGPAQINGSVWVSLCVNKAPENSLGALISQLLPPPPGSPHDTLEPPKAP